MRNFSIPAIRHQVPQRYIELFSHSRLLTWLCSACHIQRSRLFLSIIGRRTTLGCASDAVREELQRRFAMTTNNSNQLFENVIDSIPSLAQSMSENAIELSANRYCVATRHRRRRRLCTVFGFSQWHNIVPVHFRAYEVPSSSTDYPYHSASVCANRKKRNAIFLVTFHNQLMAPISPTWPH